MKRLAIIDGKSVFYRGYYAMPNLSTADGTPTGGVYGFASLALEMFKKLKPDYVAVAWDKPKTNIRKRKELYAEYKAGRKPAPPDFYEQIPILHELLGAFGWPLYELDDYEADDIMATLAVKAEAAGLETCLITSDLDALQSIAPNTHVYALKKGLSNIELFKPESFEAKYGIRVDQFLDLKALKGDSSDNIPGVPGVGEKTATELLQKYETLDAIYENLWEVKDSLRKKLEAGKSSAYLSKSVAELWIDAPVELDLEALDVTKLDTNELRTILKRLEFRSLLAHLPEYMRASAGEATDESSAAYTILPAKLVELDMNALSKATEAVVWPHDNSVYVSIKKGTVSELTQQEFAEARLETITIHGANKFLHELLRHEIALPKTTFDTRHVAFLLDPLRKSRELGDILGLEVTDPLVAIEVVRELSLEQRKKLDEKPKLKKVAFEIDLPLIPLLVRMEARGIVLDSAFLGTMNKELTHDIAKIQQDIYGLVGHEFNVSSPSQLAEVLYVNLHLSTLGIKKGKTGYSTGQKELDKLRGSHPIIELIEQYRELTKLQNTYVEALPLQADEQGRVHTTFNQDIAATGRLSSTDPNLQNIPVRSEIGRRIREAFIPSDGNVFVSADYSQFELRLAAALAGDQKMITDFNSGVDIHTKTASEVYKIPLDEVTKGQRRDAKVINFGVLYGMSPHGLAAATGMSFHDAKVFIDEYFRLRAPIRKYIDATIYKAKHDGYVETYFGRQRPTPDVHSSNFIVRQGAERQAANMPIQGTEADLMKMAMLRVEEKLHPKDSETLGWQVLQIHDSILVECPAENAKLVSTILDETMEQIYPELGITLKVDVHTGRNWGET